MAKPSKTDALKALVLTYDRSNMRGFKCSLCSWFATIPKADQASWIAIFEDEDVPTSSIERAIRLQKIGKPPRPKPNAIRIHRKDRDRRLGGCPVDRSA